MVRFLSIKGSCHLPFKPGKSFLFILFTTIFFFSLFYSIPARAQKTFEILGTENDIPIGKYSSVFYDSSGTSNFSNVLQIGKFESTKEKFPVNQVKKGFLWIRTKFINSSDDSTFFYNLQYSNISHISLYKLVNGKLDLRYKSGNSIPFNSKERVTPNFVIPIVLHPGDSATYYFKISSNHPVLFPLVIQNNKSIVLSINFQTIIIGIYLGIILAILLYNLFLYISTRDKSYLLYVAYLIFLGLAQLTLSGFAFKYLWPNSPAINNYALTVSSSLAGISGIVFAIFFLRIKKYLPKSIPYLFALIFIYLAAIIFSLFNNNYYSYQILNFAGLVGGVVLIFISAYISRLGYKPAYFYLVAWITFLLGMVVFVLRNLNILPYNNFTTYILYGGSAIEVILLSIALADKINVLRKEKEESQARSLEVSLENERLVREQNVKLEKMVAERTHALQGANAQLTNAIKNLKDAQIQLVEAEKMASLGQLTAGIAHEINNPINFVKSNIKPLTLDINDLVGVIEEYEKLHEMPTDEIRGKLEEIGLLRDDIDMPFVKNEIYNLLKGIEDGAERTAEIVRGLRTFSRLDESQLKTVNIHDGIDSTIVILRNFTPDNVQVIREYNGDGNIECYPGKLNQVFMNILSNAVQAIKMKPRTGKETITISTIDLDSKIEIRIKDSGPGMNEEVKRKIFEPFFTTKDVGEGTGLGMAIVFKIIQEHFGNIEVLSTEGEGAEFIITLHHIIPEKPFV